MSKLRQAIRLEEEQSWVSSTRSLHLAPVFFTMWPPAILRMSDRLEMKAARAGGSVVRTQVQDPS